MPHALSHVPWFHQLSVMDSLEIYLGHSFLLVALLNFFWIWSNHPHLLLLKGVKKN